MSVDVLQPYSPNDAALCAKAAGESMSKSPGFRESNREIDALWQEAAKKIGLAVPRGWTREARRKVLKHRRLARKAERERQEKR